MFIVEVAGARLMRVTVSRLLAKAARWVRASGRLAQFSKASVSWPKVRWAAGAVRSHTMGHMASMINEAPFLEHWVLT